MTPETAIDAVYQAPIVLVVLGTMLGFTPLEWAEVTTRQSDVPVTQNAASRCDRVPYRYYARLVSRNRWICRTAASTCNSTIFGQCLAVARVGFPGHAAAVAARSRRS